VALDSSSDFNRDANWMRNRGQYDLEIKISVGFDVLVGDTRNRDRAVARIVAARGMLPVNSRPSRATVGAEAARPCYQPGQALA
jgi:hypothetical protein